MKQKKTKILIAKKILITGGTGFIGYHLAKKCLKKGGLVKKLPCYLVDFTFNTNNNLSIAPQAKILTVFVQILP